MNEFSTNGSGVNEKAQYSLKLEAGFVLERMLP